jgi:hypothetical protein
VCTENLIRVDAVMESPKLAECWRNSKRGLFCNCIIPWTATVKRREFYSRIFIARSHSSIWQKHLAVIAWRRDRRMMRVSLIGGTPVTRPMNIRQTSC